MQRLVGALVALGFVLGTLGDAAQAGTTSGPSVPDLNGDWTLSAGGIPGTIHISSNYPLSGYPTLKNWFVSGANCPYGDKRTALFDSISFQNKDTFSGTMEVCTGSQALVQKCHVESKFTVQYKTTAISKTTINGTLTSEWFDNVGGDECKFRHNASKDTQEPFTLTRGSFNPCPDTDAIKAYSNDSNRAVGVINVAVNSGRIRNPQATKVLQSAESSLNDISRVLGNLIDAGDDCDKIHSLIDQITEFQGAIDQINNAGCDSSEEAAGFDNLFRTAGQLAGPFNKLPGLGPVFQLLGSDENLVQQIEANLNPEQRWADQFQYVDGYIPTCPH
jgi:hypothetical protein